MRVLLQKNVESLGYVGDLVSVKPGYARNFLLPQGLAVVANERNKKLFEHQKSMVEKKKEKEITSAKEFADKISKISLTITKAAGESDKIFGSVTTLDLMEGLKVNGITDIERRKITLPEEVKKLGVYKAHVKIHPEVIAEFSVWVVAKKTEESKETKESKESSSEEKATSSSQGVEEKKASVKPT